MAQAEKREKTLAARTGAGGQAHKATAPGPGCFRTNREERMRRRRPFQPLNRSSLHMLL